MKNDNPIQIKSFQLGLAVIKIYKYLKGQNEFVLAKQILKSGTSVGANVEEAIGGQSNKDFLMKITIAYKEARETAFWLKLLEASHYLNREQLEEAHKICDEVLRILGTIQKTTKANLK
ncbi:MAG: four helix bundle protein [Cyclobacteriaceae bacterium]|nr:four helix bundle protein [Cyclobacteriaceae bacterium]